jgi:hypothetical protein
MAAKLLPLATAANAANCRYKSLILLSGAPYGNRTRVSAVKGRRPGPLDEGRRERAPRHIERFAPGGKQCAGSRRRSSAIRARGPQGGIRGRLFAQGHDRLARDAATAVGLRSGSYGA